MADLGILAALVLAYALLSKRLERLAVSPPMAFALMGILLGSAVLDVVSFDLDSEAILLVAEITLVLVLFTDASRIDLRTLRRNATIPSRLLLIGLPLTIIAGTAAGAALLPGLEFWEAAVIAVVLAPTDAALGQAVVENRVVPRRIRQALNVESGLNDGLSVPFLTVVLALAGTEEGRESTDFYIRFAVEQIGFGVLVGVAVGAFGGALVGAAKRRDVIDGIFEQLAVLSLPIIAWAGADAVEGNGFIAAFVAGLAASGTLAGARPKVVEFAVDEGQLLNIATFFIFGASIVGPILGDIDWRVAVYAVASLTVVRMLPVAISLVGARLRPETTLFLGWFGPRGIATIVLTLVVVEEADLAGSDRISLLASATVLLSVVAHGLTATPLARRYGRRAERMAEESPEMRETPDIPTRFGS
jgi:NhaP-type Na+/H+ or K+/H+ antiporter